MEVAVPTFPQMFLDMDLVVGAEAVVAPVNLGT
jgi:glutaredoxin-related protein